jgi:FkbM family methyltransferase
MTPAATKMLQTRDGPMLAFQGDAYVTRCLEAYGEFSPGEWDLLAQIIKPGMAVIEAGANIGAHTLAMARACHPGPLFAYEPQRRVFQVLCANLALNGVENVLALPEACGAEPGQAVIPALDYAGAGNFGGVSLAPPGSAGETVRVSRIDGLGLPACGLIKADVEGYEAEALQGAAATIARCRPVLYVENDRREKREALIRLIASLGYRLYWHLPPLARRNNFNGNPEHVFGEKPIVSVNMLCLPAERETRTDLEPIDPESWALPKGFRG